MSFPTDEHVPSVFGTTLRSNGHGTHGANDLSGEATDDERRLRYRGADGHVLSTHNGTEFAGGLAATVEHSGGVVYMYAEVKACASAGRATERTRRPGAVAPEAGLRNH